MIQHPNKTFVLDIEKDTGFGGRRRHLVIIAAKNEEIATQYLKDKLGFNGVSNELVWLMNTNHTTMYDQTGNKELNVQAKILYNAVTLIN